MLCHWSNSEGGGRKTARQVARLEQSETIAKGNRHSWRQSPTFWRRSIAVVVSPPSVLDSRNVIAEKTRIVAPKALGASDKADAIVLKAKDVS